MSGAVHRLPPGTRLRLVEGEPLLPRPALEFPRDCAKCGRELNELRCRKPECEGCTFSCEDQTCRFFFVHVGLRPQSERAA